MRVTDSMTTDNAIYNINSGKIKLSKLNEQLTSNQVINRPSDDPLNARQIMDLQAQVNSSDQYISNIQNAQTWVDVANTALQGMNDSITQAKKTASNILVGMNDPVSVTNSLASLNNIRQQMIDMANVQVGDQYVFGGFNNTTTAVSNKSLGGAVDLSKPANQITGIDTTGLIVGMTVSGKGIQPGTTITNVDNANHVVTLSKNPISAGSGLTYTFGMPPTTQTGNVSIAASQHQITGIITAGLHAGEQVAGLGVPLGATITSIDNAGQVTISRALTQATASGSFSFFDPPTLSQTGNAGTTQSFQFGTAANLSTTISVVDTSVLHAGGTVTGPGVQSGSTITAVGPGNSVTISQPILQDVSTGGDFTFTAPLNVITGLDTTGLGAGDTVTGPGVPAGTSITGIGTDGSVTLNNPLPSTVSGGIFTFTPFASPAIVPQTGTTSLAPTQVTGLDTTNLSAGLMITGPGVPSGTTILSVDSASQITLSNPLTQAVTGGTFTFLPTTAKTVAGVTTSTTVLSNQLTGLADTTGLSLGMSVSGPNIPENTVITAISAGGPPYALTLNNNATQTATGGTFIFGSNLTKVGTANPPNQISGLPLAQLQNLYVGMKVTGPGVPDNTTITDIDTTDNNGTGSVTLSKIPTGPGGAGNFVFEGYINSYGSRTVIGNVSKDTSTISGLPSTINMVYAPTISKAGSTNPSVNPNQITGLADTNGLSVGMQISDNAGGTVIPPNTIVVGIDPVAKSITLSNPLTPPTSKAGDVAVGANSITNLTDVAKLFVGMPVSDNANGTIIPPNTTITSISAGPAPFTIGISQNTINAAPLAGAIFSFAPTTLKTVTDASFNFSPPISKTGATDIVTSQITGVTDTNNLFVGMPVSDNAGGTIIPPNTTITAIDPVAKTITLANPQGTPLSAAGAGTKFFFTPTMPIAGATDPVATPNMITGILNTSNLFVGMPVTGPGIPANTTITGTPTSVPATVAGTVTLSNNPTVTEPAATFYFGQYSSMNASGIGIPANSTIGAIVNNNTVNLSTAANATSPVAGTPLTFSGYFADEDIKVNINKSAQVNLNYSGAKLLLGGAPPATSQATGPPPSSMPVNILGTIGELITAIQNKDNAGIIAAASNLQVATDQINQAQGEYAARSIRLDSAQTMVSNNQDTLKNIISNKQTPDTAKTIIQLQAQTTAYQAALQATAKIMPLSLMDYLK
jgi:flagellin-like hook-associated protein FlgL